MKFLILSSFVTFAFAYHFVTFQESYHDPMMMTLVGCLDGGFGCNKPIIRWRTAVRHFSTQTDALVWMTYNEPKEPQLWSGKEIPLQHVKTGTIKKQEQVFQWVEQDLYEWQIEDPKLKKFDNSTIKIV